MGSLRNTNDIKKAVLKRCGELTDGSSAYDQDVMDYINTNYHSILAGGTEFDVDLNESWIWAQAPSPYVMSLEPYQDIVLTVTNGSTTATMSVSPAASVVGYYLRVQSDNNFEQYKISAHTGGSNSVTLDQAFLDDSGGYQTRLVKLDYQLSPQILRLIAPIIHYNKQFGASEDVGKIFQVDAATLSARYPLVRLACGVPDTFAVINQEQDTGLLTIRFNTIVDEAIRLEVPYIPIQADLLDSTASIPLIPFAFRDCLMHMASYMIMLDKSDDRVDTEAVIAKAKLTSMKMQNRKTLASSGRSYARLVPRMIRRVGRVW